MPRDTVRIFHLSNVSVINLRLVLKTVDTIFDKISLVIRFMAMFTVLTGLMVLVSELAAWPSGAGTFCLSHAVCPRIGDFARCAGGGDRLDRVSGLVDEPKCPQPGAAGRSAVSET